MPETITTSQPEVSILRHAFDTEADDRIYILDCLVTHVNGGATTDPAPPWFAWQPIEKTPLGDRARLDLEVRIRPYDALAVGITSCIVEATVSDTKATSTCSWHIAITPPPTDDPTDPEPDPDPNPTPEPDPDPNPNPGDPMNLLLVGGIDSAQLGGLDYTRIRCYSLPDLAVVQDYTHATSFRTSGLEGDHRTGRAYFFRTTAGSGSVIGEGTLFEYDPATNSVTENQALPEQLSNCAMHATSGHYYGVSEAAYQDTEGISYWKIYDLDIDAGTSTLFAETGPYDMGLAGYDSSVARFTNPPFITIDSTGNRLLLGGAGWSEKTDGGAVITNSENLLVSYDLSSGAATLLQVTTEGFLGGGLYSLYEIAYDDSEAALWATGHGNGTSDPLAWKMDATGELLFTRTRPKGENIVIIGGQDLIFSGGGTASYHPREKIFQNDRAGANEAVALTLGFRFANLCFGRS